MLTIKFIRENPDIVKKDLKKRNDLEKVKWVDDLLKKDEQYRKLLQKEQELRHKRNQISDEINQLKKQGKDIKQKIKEAKELPEKVRELTNKVEELKGGIINYLMRIPNILHDSVLKGKDEKDNKVLRKQGIIKKFDFKLKTHEDVIESLNLGNFESAANVSGKGFYYLLGDLALMETALQKFALDILEKKGFISVQVPLMLRRKAYEGVTDLKDFETMMYKVDNEDLYLIATSEHAIAAMNSNKLFDESQLPVKYVSASPCFRKEIGSHGVDERGLFRVHQFNKVEQFVFCKEEESWKLFEELIKNAEEIFKKLKLPYRVVSMCTADIGVVAAKKYDLEVYMPREKEYKEVVSCSNCTAYQSTRLNIKYQKDKEKHYAHTINSTAIATSRTLRAILENYQQKDGTVKVPDVLIPYMNGVKVLGNKK
ncbi:serine--tRNA ligase [archaeon]|jgi:seryl-tRNA synthetase|nr:serine--tRNA ligase [archaeon]MDP6548236.1 serine--tRNA ligase [Candidatus Woesearchaeota archaeon]|tara:strand:- start:1547 stop:2827 length:1281 start_codon:yes stop_codon:yes gene_type:complete